MPSPSPALQHDPAIYLPIAHLARNRPDVPFNEAMRDPAQRPILEFIATEWPKKRPQMIISICRIEQLATDAARHYASAAQANPYPADSAAGGLFIRCFDAAKAAKASAAPSPRAQAAIETVANQPPGEPH